MVMKAAFAIVLIYLVSSILPLGLTLALLCCYPQYEGDEHAPDLWFAGNGVKRGNRSISCYVNRTFAVNHVASCGRHAVFAMVYLNIYSLSLLQPTSVVLHRKRQLSPYGDYSIFLLGLAPRVLQQSTPIIPRSLVFSFSSHRWTGTSLPLFSCSLVPRTTPVTVTLFWRAGDEIF